MIIYGIKTTKGPFEHFETVFSAEDEITAAKIYDAFKTAAKKRINKAELWTIGVMQESNGTIYQNNMEKYEEKTIKKILKGETII